MAVLGCRSPVLDNNIANILETLLSLKISSILIVTSNAKINVEICPCSHTGSISHHIMPLVINSLGGGHMHTHAYRCLHRNNSKNQASTHLVLNGQGYLITAYIVQIVYSRTSSTVVLISRHNNSLLVCKGYPKRW